MEHWTYVGCDNGNVYGIAQDVGRQITLTGHKYGGVLMGQETGYSDGLHGG